MVEFEVSGDKIESIYMIPGWTHNIINLSDTEDLVTVMTCNEIFNPSHPDTFLRSCDLLLQQSPKHSNILISDNLYIIDATFDKVNIVA